MALQRNFKPLEINIHYKKVIRMLYDGNPNYNVLLYNYRCMLRELGREVVHHCFREKNGVAYILAKKDATMGTSDRLHLFIVPPVYVLDQDLIDINGTSYSRSVKMNSFDYGHILKSFIVESIWVLLFCNFIAFTLFYFCISIFFTKKKIFWLDIIWCGMSLPIYGLKEYEKFHRKLPSVCTRIFSKPCKLTTHK